MPNVTVDDVAPHVKQITLNRPERLNALNFELTADLHDALDAVGADAECRVTILTGAGRGFCSGLDLKDFGTPPASGEHPHVHAGIGGQEFMANLTVHMRSTPQIIVAAVNGAAYGGGLGIAAAADLRIAGESATFCSAFIRTGLTGTDIGVSYTLPRLLGASRAFDLIVTGRTIDAVEAEHLGLVSRVVPDDALHDEAVALASQIAAYTSIGLRMTKEVMWANLDAPNMSAAIALENRNQTIAGRNPEVQAYMDAYMAPRRGAKRPRGGYPASQLSDPSAG
jgi:enoyl-CoA hydratase